MIKKLFIFFAFILSASCVLSQTWTGERLFVKTPGYFVPPQDTTAAPLRLGELRFRTQDTSLYASLSLSASVKRWFKVTGASTGISGTPIINLGQPGALRIGTNDNTALTFIRNGSRRIISASGSTYLGFYRESDSSNVYRAVFAGGDNYHQFGGNLTNAGDFNHLGLTATAPDVATTTPWSSDVYPNTKTVYMKNKISDTTNYTEYIIENGHIGSYIGYKYSVVGNNGIFQVNSRAAGSSVGLYANSILSGQFYSDSVYMRKATTFVDTARFNGRAIFNLLTVGRVPFIGANKVISDAAGFTYNSTDNYITSRYVANAGTATAGTAPFKFTAGTLLTTPESGALETNANNAIYYSNSGGRGKVQVNTNTVSSAGTLAMSEVYSYYTFNGTTTTWTLPAISGFVGTRFTIINAGSGIITLNSNAGGNDIWESGTPTNTISINPGEIYIIYNNSLSWVIIP